MGVTRTLNVVIANEEFEHTGGQIGGPGGSIPPRRVLPTTLTSRLRRYELVNEYPFYSLALHDSMSTELRGTEWAPDEYEPASLMAPLQSWVAHDNAHCIGVTTSDDSQLSPSDDVEITACTVEELATVYKSLWSKHPACTIKLRQDSPVLYQLLEDIRSINNSRQMRERIVLFIWE